MPQDNPYVRKFSNIVLNFWVGLADKQQFHCLVTGHCICLNADIENIISFRDELICIHFFVKSANRGEIY